MSKNVDFKLIGAKQLEKRLKLHKLALKPLRNYYVGTAIVVIKQSKKHAPEFSGKMKNAITYKPLGTRGRLPAGITVFVDPMKAPYAKYVHGYMHQSFRQSKPWDRTRPHFPPVSALVDWSSAKGLNPYAVAMGIAKRGTPIVPFLKIGYNKSRSARNILLAKVNKDITNEWKKSRKPLM